MVLSGLVERLWPTGDRCSHCLGTSCSVPRLSACWLLRSAVLPPTVVPPLTHWTHGSTIGSLPTSTQSLVAPWWHQSPPAALASINPFTNDFPLCFIDPSTTSLVRQFYVHIARLNRLPNFCLCAGKCNLYIFCCHRAYITIKSQAKLESSIRYATNSRPASTLVTVRPWKGPL